MNTPLVSTIVEDPQSGKKFSITLMDYNAISISVKDLNSTEFSYDKMFFDFALPMLCPEFSQKSKEEILNYFKKAIEENLVSLEYNSQENEVKVFFPYPSSKDEKFEVPIYGSKPITYDDSKPKRPLSSYMYFQKERIEELKNKNPNLDLAVYVKQFSEEWKNMNEEKKAKYKELAENDKKRYDTEMEIWNKNHKK